MRKIDAYVDKICNNFNESDEEIENIKEEMKAHLYEEVEELKKQGFSEEESIEKALNAFGKENSIVKEMNTIWKKENEFSIFILKGALVTFIIACLFMAISVFYKSNDKKYVNSNSEYTINAIYKEINEKNNIKKDEIDKYLDEFNKKNDNGLYYLKIEKLKNTKYEYKKDVSENMIKNNYEGKLIKGDLGIYYKETDSQREKNLENLYKLTESKANSINIIFKQIAYVLFLFSLTILWMASYSYIGGNSKFILAIAALDICTIGILVVTDEFSSNVKMVILCIWAVCLLVFGVLNLYCDSKKTSNKYIEK